MDRLDFMTRALGADVDTMMKAMNHVLDKHGTPFTPDQAEAMRWGLEKPEVRMEVISMFAEMCEKAGIFK